jgi:hypothetical protein
MGHNTRSTFPKTLAMPVNVPCSLRDFDSSLNDLFCMLCPLSRTGSGQVRPRPQSQDLASEREAAGHQSIGPEDGESQPFLTEDCHIDQPENRDL